jgi:hypothetical protein
MLNPLKLAIKEQKRLVLIFSLSIFLPSVTPASEIWEVNFNEILKKFTKSGAIPK